MNGERINNPYFCELPTEKGPVYLDPRIVKIVEPAPLNPKEETLVWGEAGKVWFVRGSCNTVQRIIGAARRHGDILTKGEMVFEALKDAQPTPK